MTKITLTPELEAWAEDEVRAGRADSVEAFVVGTLQRFVASKKADDDWVRSKLDEARASVARGDVIDGDVFFAEVEGWIAEDEQAVSPAE